MVVLNPSSTSSSVQSQLDLMAHVGEFQQKDHDQNGGFVQLPREHGELKDELNSIVQYKLQIPPVFYVYS